MVEIRPIRTDPELQGALDLIRAVYPERAMLLREIREIEATGDHARFGAYDGDRLVGTVTSLVEPRLREQSGAFASIVVLPEERGHGVGTRLYETISDWARGIGIELFEGNVKDDEAACLAWAERRGFAVVARDSALELDLTAIAAPSIEPPDGVEIVRWVERPELAEALYEVACEAYPDIPGNEGDAMEPFEDWLAHDMAGPGDKPEATFVALAGDDVVGYAKFSLTEAQPTIAHHDVTGVKRAWRGRGIAGALKRAEISWAKENGYERLQTMNEERNAPIRKLNERYGYRRIPGRIVVHGPLAP